MEVDYFTLVVPYALKAEWHEQLANQAKEDGPPSPKDGAATSDILAQGSYSIMSSEDASCLQPSALSSPCENDRA
jgi:hypothetical protein